MIKQALEIVAKACGGKIVQKGLIDGVFGVSTDSRTTKNGDLFIPLIGENFDGHNYIETAIEKGASAVLFQGSNFSINKNTNDKVSFIEVDNTLEALQNLSKYYRNLFTIPFIGITGSTGKTTTKDMVSHVLSYKYNTLKNIGNLNNQIGLPLTIFNLEENHEACVVEMGMSGLGEISDLAEIARPEIAIITNIGLSHIEHLGSQENIFKAKMEISNFLNEDNFLLLNGDDKFLKKAKESEHTFNKVSIGLSEDNDLYAENIKDLKDKGYVFDVKINNKLYTFNLDQPGLHNVYNALFAIWVGTHFNMTPEEIDESFRQFKPSKMRLEIVKLKDFTLINDAYNASPDSMTAALKVLSNMDGNKKIAILGNMFEMGEHSEYGHRLVGEAAVTNNIDYLITVGNFAEWIAEEALDKGMLHNNVYKAQNNEEALKTVLQIVSKGDIVLLKGSRGMKMDEIATEIQERS
ncbi:UDP-N-acetylmuramoyl-tripeptide--D-alanyl-D-alanine ligase [Serpentinicella alkaliphila]|uniref:UDP-N-acetylmuramoyl-tripeptide--D-alanyl-D-alanine ligase n=1 Tax=Serpentinicella alkaliphila TaxID=1734049 RepID=A0A4V2T577_9FIRM|nr:UDP-N-acetylmuramoyl-tripeptide--D-alanyl-D-alanine ligase [Serpentinicella alkaliphila]QUH26773.1 UDP-N-acetylmuramoyl-tripeptide--D-alanyl-D-alanine ligase [Serpentinicella alkaliphila]TCQ07994.1 UDP-N-acetylmuramoyl-tripeptide--D-alanyl-D-alanine ligase [Serpentinicella alkaliphila]